MSGVRLIGEAGRGIARGKQSQQLVDEKRASGKELKGFEARASRNGWQLPVRVERMSFFSAENALLITVHQIIFLWKFPILPDSYFKFVLGRNCHTAGIWHFWQALIIHVFYLEAKSVRSFQSGSYSWADREALSLALASSHLPGSLTPWQFCPPRQKSGWQDPFKTATSKSNKVFVPSDWNVSLFCPNETWMYKQFCEKSLTLPMTLESTKVLW